jgi:hypothetical protein
MELLGRCFQLWPYIVDLVGKAFAKDRKDPGSPEHLRITIP